MLSVTLDNRAWIDHLEDCKTNQGPFALKTAINMVAANVQGVERLHMRDIFTERRPDWLDRSVKITQFATKSNPTAVVGIHPPGANGDSRADILTKFEDQDEKTPRGKMIAIPIEARRNKRDIVLNSQRPRALIGNNNVFLIKKANGVELILQHVTRGARKGANKLLYLLVPRVPIQPDLAFETNALKTIDASWEASFDVAWDQAMSNAK